MLKSKTIDAVCIAVLLAALAVTALFMGGERLGLVPANTAPGYETRLFDRTRVHTVDIVMEDWEGFLSAGAEEEAYSPCTLIIDGEAFSNVGLRVKGNNSRRLTAQYGLDRFSLKAEFDHYQYGSYYGLDKFSLDASFQDNSYMKTWLAYDMMEYMGVVTPLRSFVWVTVNGEDWGLFLAIEEPEESFASRNYGDGYGQLYKPDYQSLDAENADVSLRYTGDDPENYGNIFRNAKFDPTDADKARLIAALKTLASGEDLETAVDIDAVLRYFAVQVFVLNPDSYLGPTGHNYFLYEEDGVLSILPWDYNLAFGTYCLGMSNPIRDPNILINYPINTPWEGSVMLGRPLFHNVMKYGDSLSRYHGYCRRLVSDYVEGGRLEALLEETTALISPYVARDATAFCSHEDFLLAVDTLEEVCRLRAMSIAGQLDGRYPITLAQRAEYPGVGVDASHLNLEDLGDFDDLEQ